MNITNQQAEKLLRGHYVFKQFSFSMLLTRLKNDYALSPSQAKLEQCANELNTFLTKYKVIMGQDFAVIQNI